MDKATPKRGRKPKAEPVDVDVELTIPIAPDVIPEDEGATDEKEEQDTSAIATANAVAAAAAKKTRRGRKPKAVYNGFDNPDANMQMVSDDENVIMKLHVNMEQFDEISNADDESCSGPDAFNISLCNTYSKPVDIGTFESSEQDLSVFYNDSNDQVQSSANGSCNKLKVIHLLKDFEEKNKNNEWPSNTSIVCYWCCHRFDNAPYGIPVKYCTGKFHVYGCFCSLECAAAYNLDSKESIDEMWERYNLINLLARRIGYNLSYVKPAPDRLALKMFGGYLSIEEFRRYTTANKLVNINFPPMMSMTQQIEEINESDINNEYKYIPLDTERINKYKEKIKLKRTKPLHDFKNTLDHAMNLKFGA